MKEVWSTRHGRVTNHQHSAGLHTGFGARGGQNELPKILGGQHNMGVYRCTETGGGGGVL